MDGGINSPSAQPDGTIGHEQNPGTPYFVNPGVISSKGKALGGNGGWTKDGTYRIFDDPTFRNVPFSRIRFQTIIVAQNFYGSGLNVIMGVYNWGFDKGAPTHEMNRINWTDPTSRSLDILSKDYPSYQLSQ